MTCSRGSPRIDRRSVEAREFLAADETGRSNEHHIIPWSALHTDIRAPDNSEEDLTCRSARRDGATGSLASLADAANRSRLGAGHPYCIRRLCNYVCYTESDHS